MDLTHRVRASTLHLTTLRPTVLRGEYAYGAHLLTVERAREIVKLCSLRPWQGDGVVVHLTSAHNLREDVWPVLLKLIEEPPDTATIHLYAPSLDGLPRTIRGRCRVEKGGMMEPEFDGSRLTALAERGEATAIIREGDRYESRTEVLEALEGLRYYAARTGRVGQAHLAEHFLRSSGVPMKVLIKTALLKIAMLHRGRS